MNSRRDFVKKGALAAAAIVATDPLRAIAGFQITGSDLASHQHTVTIFHTADLGGQLHPISDGSAYHGLGGYRQLAGTVKSLRRKAVNSILLDAGHMEEELFPIAAELNYDGVHVEASKINPAINLPVISFHPVAKKQEALPYRIITKGVIKTGVISAKIESGNTTNVVAAALEMSEYLKNVENCQLVVCLSNLGLDKNKRLNDYMLARRSTYIDMIIGSGKGNILRTPHTCFNKNKGEVIINHSGYGGLVLGKIDFHFNDRGEKTGLEFHNLVIGKEGYSWKGLPSEEKPALA